MGHRHEQHDRARRATSSRRYQDIASALGVSTGTVDPALHAKPGINAMTRARVLHMAGSLGYRPHLAARH
jgi:DNA-binding LacI/PurR family transcriptional regulator